ncbi:MAG TPA: PQQ-binding-like beta-propeller repeat protein, partial [Ktedonobacterales bacterium]
MMRCGKPARAWVRGAARLIARALLGAVIVTALALLPDARALAVGDSWPTYMHDAQRTGASADTTLAPANVAQLAVAWKTPTSGMIAAAPSLADGMVFIGSWDGYEYALNATTGAVVWKTFLGITSAPTCSPPSAGVTSAATIQGGVVYVGGGDAYWYALDESTGAVLWRVFTGDNSAAGGHYNWSSPLIANGSAYIGIASMGDCPLVQGQLLQVSLSTHLVTNTLNIVPNGQTGGGIWTTPALDPATNTIYVTTGTLNMSSQTMSQAMLAVDANTLAVRSVWQVPAAEVVNDSDWGTSPVLYTDAGGRQLVAAINKNGIVYSFDRTNVANGPVWRRLIAYGGQCPTCGDGSVSNLAFANDTLFAAGGATTIAGRGYKGGVRALDPATGNIIWEHGDPAPIIPALAYDNGFVLAGAGAMLEALDAGTGARLYGYTTGGTLFGPPAVANGTIYFGSLDHNVYALALPATPPPPPPPDPQCPTGWICQDIGAPAPAGSETTTGAAWTIAAGGVGLGGTSDSFRFIAQGISGDGQITLHASALAASSAGATVGLMLRQSADPGAPFYAVLLQPGNKALVQYRQAFGGATTTLNTIGTASLPLWLLAQRVGDQLSAATSTDGTSYTLIPGATATVLLPTAALAGVAAASGLNGTAGSATVDSVTPGAVTITPAPVPPASPCPAGWSCADIGNPLVAGDQTLAAGTWTISGAGSDISNFSDQFHYVWQSFAADATISARVVTQSNTSTRAKAGIMLRQNADAAAAFYAAVETPGQGMMVLARSGNGLRAQTLATQAATLPAYLQITRSGNTFSTYTSSDGVTWTYLAGTAITLTTSGTMLGGLAITANATATAGSATLDTVALATSAPPPPIACPTGWSCADVGFALPAGNEALNGGTWTIQGGGNDIWSTADQFHYDWQSLLGDGTLSARVTAQSNSNVWAKAGVMLRLSSDPGAPY